MAFLDSLDIIDDLAAGRDNLAAEATTYHVELKSIT